MQGQGATISSLDLRLIKPEHIAERLEHFEFLTVTKLESLRIIMSFEERGWALYEAADDLASTQGNLEEIIREGRAWEALKINTRYLILPLCHRDKDFRIVVTELKELTLINRGPRYVEILRSPDPKAGGFWMEPVAFYWIDSIIFKPNELLLVMNPDRPFTGVRDSDRIFPGRVISLRDNYLYIIKKQFTKARR
jgi:hypothetical protein